MVDTEDITTQHELLSIYRRNLARLLRQQAELGGEAYVTPAVANGIIDARDQIRRIKNILIGWSQVVDTHPDDETQRLHYPELQSPDQAQTQSPRLANSAVDASVTVDPLALVDPGDPIAPFIAGPPIIHPRAFFGREPIVRRIFDLLKRPPLQNAVIIGPRRSGKSSLLHYLRSITRTPADRLRPGQRSDWLSNPERYRWVLVDFQDVRFGRKEGLLRYLLTSLNLRVPTPCTLDRFLDVMSTSVRQPTVVLLDEIGKALRSYPDLDDDVWESLRALGPQVGGNLGFVLASHSHPVQLAHDSGHSSPFFNIFGYTARLGPFAETEARALIASSPMLFDEEDVAWILEQSGHWPILLQILCRERLITMYSGDTSGAWKIDVLSQLEPFRYLLNSLT
jgi:hypothetical protein